MTDLRITTVRYAEEQAREQLKTYLFGGYRVGPRVPRGIEPDLVSEIIQEELNPTSPPDAYAKAVNTLRFYEQNKCLDHLRRALTGAEKDRTDVLRSAYAIQAVGEVGARDKADEAAKYFDDRLAKHSATMDATEVLLETLIVLAPSGSTAKLAARIAEEVRVRKTAEKRDEKGMRAYQTVAAIQRLKLPRAQAAIDVKAKLTPMPPPDRRADLLAMYLGRSPVSDDLMMTWAARLLRREAMEVDAEPVRAAFAAEIDKVDPKKVGEDAAADTVVSRCAQAIVYLGGRLSKPHRELNQKVRKGAMNFLWDDLKQ
jgi:hypothetical protein